MLKASFGIVRNTRPCEVTEIGFRSRVFQRLSGVTNFQNIPQPQELINMDNNEVQITSGTVSSYIRRASVFSVEGREVGRDDITWRPLSQLFAVVGSKPVDQYNYLRFTHPQTKVYEYRFVPRNGANLNDIGGTERVIVLGPSVTDGNNNRAHTLSGDLSTPFGTFQYLTTGVFKDLTELKSNKEFCNEASQTVSTPSSSRKPSRVSVYNR